MVKTFLISGLKFESQWTHSIARLVSLYIYMKPEKRQHRPRYNTPISITYTITKTKSDGSTEIRTPALTSETGHHGLRLDIGYETNRLRRSFSWIIFRVYQLKPIIYKLLLKSIHNIQQRVSKVSPLRG
jgi:hypothetical protein